MKLIPAIDLKNNKVVIPYGNSRSDYKEIPKDKSPTSDPIKFIDFLLSELNYFSNSGCQNLDFRLSELDLRLSKFSF